MTQALCQVESCDRPSHDATICRTCASDLERALGDIPALADELDTTLARQTALGDCNGKARSATRPLPYDPRASEAQWVLRNRLVGWVRELSGDGTESSETDAQRRAAVFPDDNLASMARWLLARSRELAQHSAGGEAVDEITRAVDDVWRVIDRPPGTLYAGGCDGTGRVPAEDDGWRPCGYALHAYPSAAWVRCPLCGATYDMAAREDWLLDAMEDAVGSPEELAACFRRVDIPVAYSTICAYAQQKRIPVHSRGARGYPLYRGGDVLDVRFKRQQRMASLVATSVYIELICDQLDFVSASPDVRGLTHVDSYAVGHQQPQPAPTPQLAADQSQDHPQRQRGLPCVWQARSRRSRPCEPRRRSPSD